MAQFSLPSLGRSKWGQLYNWFPVRGRHKENGIGSADGGWSRHALGEIRLPPLKCISVHAVMVQLPGWGLQTQVPAGFWQAGEASRSSLGAQQRFHKERMEVTISELCRNWPNEGGPNTLPPPSSWPNLIFANSFLGFVRAVFHSPVCSRLGRCLFSTKLHLNYIREVLYVSVCVHMHVYACIIVLF